MILKYFLLFLAIFGLVNSIDSLELENTPCSTDPSNAYLDAIIMIDSSANMGQQNLKKIATTLTLAFSKFPIGNKWNVTNGDRNTRVSVIRYADNATIVANYTQINSIQDLSRVVNNIQMSNTKVANIYDAVLKSLYVGTNCTIPWNCSICTTFERPKAFLLFAASSNTPDLDLLYGLVGNLDFFDDGTFITVNFNSSDDELQNLLHEFTVDKNFNVAMYNYKNSSKTLTSDVEWALTQANCYCQAFDGSQMLYYDSKHSRYARSRECLSLQNDNTEKTVDACAWPGLKNIPVFILSSNKTEFVKKIWQNDFQGNPLYIGLHKNSSIGQWVWYDYDLNEFPLTGYNDWAVGQPNSDGCAALFANDLAQYAWQSTTCNTLDYGNTNVMCQSLACDTTSLSCCAICNGGFEEQCKYS